MLEKRGAFRAAVTEQANWLRNNPTDAFSLIELTSYAKTALHDPEYAIAQERWVLDHLKRADDDEQYDRDMDALSADLDKRGRSQEALKMMDELVRLNPDDATLWADRSMPLLHLGRTREAVQSLRKSLELDPSFETIHEALADALVQSGELSAAETEYRAAVSTYNAKYKKGETTNSLDSLVKGLVNVEAAHHAEHSLAQTHLKLARVLMDQKKWGEAVSETQAALDADTNELSAHYLRAQIYDAQGDHESATKSRQAATAAITQLAKSDKGGSEIDIDPRVVFLLSGG
jgi:Flp pilus assembly protein TadD